MMNRLERGIRVAFASVALFGGVACDRNQLKEIPPKITHSRPTPTLIPTATLVKESPPMTDIDDSVIRLCKKLSVETPKISTGKFNWPTYGPINNYFDKYHSGIDIGPDFGSPVYAADGGVVVWIAEEVWSYGHNIVVSHGFYLTLYAHLSEILVGLGDEVPKGKLVGRVGSTGKSSGPHLHFEIIKKSDPCQRIDPLSLLP